jgi:hypothetical protein
MIGQEDAKTLSQEDAKTLSQKIENKNNANYN